MPLEATGVATPWRTSAVAVLLLSIAATGSRGLELSGCGSALGMESRDIKDSAITSSSAYDAGSVGPQHGRLRNDKQGGAWCPRQMVSRDAREWLEVSLEEMHVITGSRTQGRFGNGQGQEYAEEFMLDYWRPGFVKWVRWKNRQGKELLPGNTNTYTIVDQKFDPPVIASKIRFLPYSDHVRTVCMRVEVFGCKWKDGLVSYSVPQGVQRGPELDLTDRTYDGRLEGGQLIGGLGQLVDGQRGLDNFRLDIAGLGKGYEWVGWKNDTPGWAGHPLELLFEFDKVRNFSAVHLHASNYFSKDVQVFSHARVFFSFNGNTFSGEAVQFSYMPDLVLEHARNVTIKLHQRTGRFLKIQLYFASRWLLLSEVAFDSVPLHGNYTDTTEALTVPPLAEKEYSVQRDEVQNPVVEKPPNRTVQVQVERERPPEEPRGQFGPVIGVLTVVIFLLVGAIGVIMYRNKWIKGEEELEEVKGRYGNGDQTTIEDEGECDKAVLYAESCRTAHFTNSSFTSRSDDKEVRDVISRDYTATLKKEPSLSYSAVSPPVLNFLQKPPPVPPPPEGYFRDVITPLPLVSTPVSPLSGSLTRASVNSHFVLPLSPEPDLPSDPEDEKTVVEDFPRDRLRVVEKLGSVQYGDVHLCEGGECGLVVVHTLRLQSCREEFVREVKALSRIKHANVARLLGACLDSDPVCAVREYAPMGDLCQFLQDHVAETATPLVPTASTLSYGCLIYMATQISSGMEYLESSRYVHKDLAARNCLVGRRYEIKISDLGSYRELYSSDYCQVAGTRPLPVRWMAWESVLLGKYTSKSDVWSFAVLLWEVLTFAREQPFEELNDDKVVENVTHFYQDTGRHVLLNCPINCPKEIYDLMCECWQRNESDRPSFREIHLFLQRKNLGYNPELH